MKKLTLKSTCNFDGGDCGNEDYSPCSLCSFPFVNDNGVEFDNCTIDGPWGYLPQYPFLRYCKDEENDWIYCGVLDC
jgi:hypothetical protein